MVMQSVTGERIRRARVIVRMGTVARGIAAALVACWLLAVGCADGVGPNERQIGGLQLALELTRDTVTEGDTLVAHVILKNVVTDTLWLGSGNSCLAFVGVFKGGNRQPGFAGTDYACLAVVTAWVITPGDSLVQDWEIGVGTRNRSVAAGDYTFRVDFDVTPELGSLEQRFVVR